jgi:23S rRNA pseudouridine2604 synthase
MFGILVWVVAALAASSSNTNNNLRVNRALRATHSRRETNQFIMDGRLLVNGITATNPNTRLLFGDEVQFDGIMIEWEEGEIEPHRYMKYNKPAGVVCTTDRRVPHNIMDALSGSETSNSTRRIYPIGRLDADSTGLILLTSNGAIVNPLLRPGERKKSKQYHVTTSPRASDRNIKDLAGGVVITTLSRVNGGMANVTARTLPCTVERIQIQSDDDGVTDIDITADSSSLKFVLSEGRNRQIRKMVASMGMEVTKLHRVKFSGVSLAGCDHAGDWAILSEQEELLIGARLAPTRDDLRSPEEKAKRKAKKLAKKRFGK